MEPAGTGAGTAGRRRPPLHGAGAGRSADGERGPPLDGAGADAAAAEPGSGVGGVRAGGGRRAPSPRHRPAARRGTAAAVDAGADGARGARVLHPPASEPAASTKERTPAGARVVTTLDGERLERDRAAAAGARGTRRGARGREPPELARAARGRVAPVLVARHAPDAADVAGDAAERAVDGAHEWPAVGRARPRTAATPPKETTMQRMKRLAAEAKATAAARFASKPSSKPAGPKASERFRAAAMDFHRRASESMAALREKKKAPETLVQRKPAFASPVATDPASPSANCFSIGDDEEGDELDYQSPQSTPPRPKKEPVPLTAAEQESLALAQHRIAGLTKGRRGHLRRGPFAGHHTIYGDKTETEQNGREVWFVVGRGAEAAALRRREPGTAPRLRHVRRDGQARVEGPREVEPPPHGAREADLPRARERDVVALHIRARAWRAPTIWPLKANARKVARAVDDRQAPGAGEVSLVLNGALRKLNSTLAANGVEAERDDRAMMTRNPRYRGNLRILKRHAACSTRGAFRRLLNHLTGAAEMNVRRSRV